ncbi:alpha-L-fucosidase [Pseudobacter ginsenosidimutans]|uniref:alpha-L-fucosidase n=1 Tax=Pseudobacter ginsenosidimutans TaxID=661488 RepID=A0A4V2F1W9_9BACT|nr:alpha-L-fucosidase [Pseudobacter ginsenosidimutans]QEC43816.1 alpha-L-fucosidase [Pseudobacter ginsenosidimutans]RZS75236.1 alpha-L-fucosidase [Pseudobacter ginsenosidimutans]
MKRLLLASVLIVFCYTSALSQTMDEMWDNRSNGKEHPNIKWFKDAKFGMFIHWGLYSKLGGEWKGKKYYGSGEWIMSQGKIPAKEYEQVAAGFNPIAFNADEWAQLTADAGMKYMVITAKHHEGFSMYDSKVTSFDMVDATPYGKDPMKPLSEATRKRGIQFGFYYSQFQDWHEPNGGKNSWDFDESKKNYQLYYQQKAIPQIKELLTKYGPLGILWFDTPGGMTKEQTQSFIDSLRLLQPGCLFSSRVGHGLGDYKDLGDSEIPATPLRGAWESLYTHNDSWGYIQHDLNFKTPEALIQLLAQVASRGGNLLLNVGPDGNGRIPEYSIRFLRETGKWLKENGASIYGTSFGRIADQPWGVSTSGAGKQFLHVLHMPADRQLLVPLQKRVVVSKVYLLKGKQALKFTTHGNDINIQLPSNLPGSADHVVVMEYKGSLPDYDLKVPVTVSPQFSQNNIEAVNAALQGNGQIKSLTYSHYYGDWKHTTCITDIKDSTDEIRFNLRITAPGDYRVIMEYACEPASAKQEGICYFNNEPMYFRTLKTGSFEKSAPLIFIKQVAGIVSAKAGQAEIRIRPAFNGKELFKLKSVIIEPVK